MDSEIDEIDKGIGFVTRAFALLEWAIGIYLSGEMGVDALEEPFRYVHFPQKTQLLKHKGWDPQFVEKLDDLNQDRNEVVHRVVLSREVFNWEGPGDWLRLQKRSAKPVRGDELQDLGERIDACVVKFMAMCPNQQNT